MTKGGLWYRRKHGIVATANCVQCGVSLHGRRADARVCSQKCETAHQVAVHRARRQVRICALCGGPVRRSSARFCSKNQRCRLAGHRDWYRRKHPCRECLGCGKRLRRSDGAWCRGRLCRVKYMREKYERVRPLRVVRCVYCWTEFVTRATNRNHCSKRCTSADSALLGYYRKRFGRRALSSEEKEILRGLRQLKSYVGLYGGPSCST